MRILSSLLWVLLLLGLADTAAAGTAEIRTTPAPCDIVCSKYGGDPPPLKSFAYDGATGEANAVTLTCKDCPAAGKVGSGTGAQTIVLRDGGAQVSAGPGCTSIDAHTARCETQYAAISVNLGDGNDSFTGDTANALSVDGGAGNDSIRGDRGWDRLVGGGGRDRLAGGAGDDWLSTGDVPESPDADVVNGGPGWDEVDYSDRKGSLVINLGRHGAVQGESGEHDDLSSVEGVYAGAGDDRLTASRLGDFLSGGDGDDRLIGGRGDDALDGGDGRDVFRAGRGDDSLTVTDAVAERIDCGAGSDAVQGVQESEPDPEYGLTEEEDAPPDPDDLLVDCESVYFAGQVYTKATPLKRDRHVTVMANPCAVRRDSTGIAVGSQCDKAVRVSLFAGKRKLGSARFGLRQRRVNVPARIKPGQTIRVVWEYRDSLNYKTEFEYRFVVRK